MYSCHDRATSRLHVAAKTPNVTASNQTARATINVTFIIEFGFLGHHIARVFAVHAH
jgi:hypothetical protein